MSTRIKDSSPYSHGTIQRYENGCRCILCNWAWLKYQRDAYPVNKLSIKLPRKPRMKNGNHS